MDTAVPAGVTLDNGFRVHDLKLLFIICDLDFVDRNDTDDAEDRSFWLPALRATAGVIVKDVGAKRHFYRMAVAFAMELAPRHVWVAFLEAIVDQWMQREAHVCSSSSKVYEIEVGEVDKERIGYDLSSYFYDERLRWLLRSKWGHRAQPEVRTRS
jgi:hypothetical protein